MKRIVLCILAVMMLIFAFGCQKKEAEPEPTATPEPRRPNRRLKQPKR